MKKLLITGGSGFIGGNLINYLLKNTDWQIINYDKQLMSSFIAQNNKERLHYVQGDILDVNRLLTAVDHIDAIIHLAADTRVIDSIKNPDLNFTTNVLGTYHILSLARAKQVPLVVNASTGGAILGNAEIPFHEKLLPQPLSPYGASKAAAEAYCHAFSASYGIRTVSLRFSNVYGIGSLHKGSVVAHFFKQILSDQVLYIYGDGEQLRDYINVEDVCHGIYLALTSDVTFNCIQIASGVAISINTLLENIKKVIGVNNLNVVYKDACTGEVKNIVCDITCAKTYLNFLPKISLEEGLSVTWNWFKNREIGKYD